MAFPLSYLLTAIPMPNFFYAGLSSKLQLWSSALGVGCLQLIGITAFREGNVIDLGPVQLQVVEACSGIRYLLPLATLALLCAYLFKDRMWKRIVLVLSSIPISILVNGLRIGVIGILVENYGQGAAEGFYHLFEGWVLFMASLGMLIFEMWWLSTIGSKHESASFLDRFTWTSSSLPPLTSNDHASSVPSASSSSFLPSAYFFSVAMLIPFSLSTSVFVEREELSPPRTDFVDFPMALHGWQGELIALEQRYIDQLRFDDYVLAEYRNGKGEPVNFYSAYYRSQKKGQSAHSPQSCLPGGGWEIASLASIELRSTTATGAPLRVNRAVIQKDREKQVLFYWFKQRERNVTSEYLVKFYMLWDALFRNRTDGALVRITSLVGSGETEAQADQRLREFAAIVEPELTKYVPD